MNPRTRTAGLWTRRREKLTYPDAVDVELTRW